MREATIICPNTSRKGDAGAALKFALKACAATFGGYTATTANGGWIDPATGDLIEEPVTVITVAATPGEATTHALRWIALRIGRIAHQECVYTRDVNGDVTLHPTRELWDTSNGRKPQHMWQQAQFA